MAGKELSFDVKAKLNEALYYIATFAVTRYPYVCAVLLMMSTGELMKSAVVIEKSFLDITYAHLGLLFLSGTAMAFNMFGTKRLFALITALQFAFMCYESYVGLKNRESTLVRVLSRNIAVIGCYLQVAGGLTDFERGTQRHRKLLQTGLQIVGVHSFVSAVILWNSSTEFNAHVSHLPGGVFTTYLFALLYVICGMCLYGGYQTFYFAKLLAWLLVIVTVFVDTDPKYWWSASNTGHWDVMTIASKNACVVFTLLLIRDNKC